MHESQLEPTSEAPSLRFGTPKQRERLRRLAARGLQPPLEDRHTTRSEGARETRAQEDADEEGHHGTSRPPCSSIAAAARARGTQPYTVSVHAPGGHVIR